MNDTARVLQNKLEQWLDTEIDASSIEFLETVEKNIARQTSLSADDAGALRAWANDRARTLPLGWTESFALFEGKAPFYVAFAFHEALNDLKTVKAQPRAALFALCETVEAVTRFVALAATADLIADNGGVAPEWLVKLAHSNLATPTFGKWMSVLRAITDNTAPTLFPEIKSARRSLEALTKGDHSERAFNDIVALRNALAHGGGIAKSLAHSLIEHWGVKIAAVLPDLAWLNECEIWARDEEGVRRLNGFKPVEASAPPEVLPRLRPGSVILRRGDRLTPLNPFGRFAPGGVDNFIAQLYAREGSVGLIYTLFGDYNQLQQETLQDELTAFRKLFPSPEQEKRGKKYLALGIPDYDNDFRRDAAKMVGRAEELDQLCRAIGETKQGVLSVIGAAGIGKSTLIAKAIDWINTEAAERANEGNRTVILAYRFREGDRGCAPLPFLQWLIVRLDEILETEMANPDLSASLASLRNQADERLNKLAESDIDKLVLVLDGLDEFARRETGFIADWMKEVSQRERLLILAGARPDAGVLALLKAAGERSALKGELSKMTAQDIRIMLVERLPRIAKKFVQSDLGDEATRNAFIEAVAERAEGLPIYANLVAIDCQKGDLKLSRREDGTLVWNTEKLPSGLNEYFKQLTQRGALSDRVRNGPLIGAWLALAREPLSRDELYAFLNRALPQPRDGGEERRKYLNEILRDLGGLLISTIDTGGNPRYRLYHSKLIEFVRSDDAMRDTCAEATLRLREAAKSPGEDGASAYLHRNGVAHLIEFGSDPKELAEDFAAAAHLLSDLDNQIARLSALAPGGGDGGLRTDWAAMMEARAKFESLPALGKEQDAWRKFWSTDGSLFRLGEGRDSARELIERCLEYAPDTVIGGSVNQYVE